MTMAAPPRRPRRFDSLLARAGLIVGAVAVVLVSEVVLALALARSTDRHMAEFTKIDRRGQSLLVTAGKMNDFLFDLSLADGTPENLPPVLAHWHTHLIALGPVEAELTRQGRVVPGLKVSDLLRMSSELQLAPSKTLFSLYVEEARSIVETYSRETLHMLVEVDVQRKRHAADLQSARDRTFAMMLGMGILGAALLVGTSATFLVDVTRRLRQLQVKAKAIAHGDFGDPLPVSRRDELGEVVEAMNLMAGNLVERNRQLNEIRTRMAHQEKMQALGMFATGIAHEIGNPIQAVSALCYQVIDSLSSDASPANVKTNVQLVDAIGVHADRLARTVGQIADYAHPGEPEFQFVDVNEVIRATVALMRFDPRFKRIDLATEYLARSPVVRAVHDQLVQLVMNLLVNAADAIDQARGGGIRVTTEDLADEVRVVVADTGAGMGAEVLEKACEPFFTTKPRSHGTGMGLAISRSILDAHKGTFRIESEPGQGTRVTMTLPRGEGR